MRDSVNPALAAALYSLILIAAAFLMARQGAERTTPAGDGEDGGPSLLRGTSVALCIVAMLLPMARVVGTTASGDLLLLGGAMAAAGAALVHLVRGSARDDGDDPRGRPETGRLGRPTPRHASRALQATRMPVPTHPYDVRPALPGVQSAPARPDPRPEAASDVPPAEMSADRFDELPQTPAGGASRTLHEVEDVVGGYAQRLGLDGDTGSTGAQRAPGTERGSNP